MQFVPARNLESGQAGLQYTTYGTQSLSNSHCSIIQSTQHHTEPGWHEALHRDTTHELMVTADMVAEGFTH